jgi:hypothetical protein
MANLADLCYIPFKYQSQKTLDCWYVVHAYLKWLTNCFRRAKTHFRIIKTLMMQRNIIQKHDTLLGITFLVL